MNDNELMGDLRKRISELEEALKNIVYVCTYPRDSMRSKLNDCYERGDLILDISKKALKKC